jgi:hypothetical protein
MLSFSSAAIGYDDTKLKPLTPIPSINKAPSIDAGPVKSYRNVSDIAKPTQDNTILY